MHQALNPHLSADVRKRARKHAVNKIVREISEKQQSEEIIIQLHSVPTSIMLVHCKHVHLLALHHLSDAVDDHVGVLETLSNGVFVSNVDRLQKKLTTILRTNFTRHQRSKYFLTTN